MPQRLDRSQETFDAFKMRISPVAIIDSFELLLEDLFLIRNPPFKFKKDHQPEAKAFAESYLSGRSTDDAGEWFFFPWNSTLVHYLPDEEHQEIRTARNRNIIRSDEQTRLYDLKVGYAGLSVGSHALFTYALMGGGRDVVIADPDTVSPSNLNRIRFDYLAVGRKKTDLAREYLYQLNPYGTVTAYDDGVTDANMDAFFSSIQVLVEETDNLEMKIRLRLEAKKRGIPVLMATDNGDNIIFEADRFDLNPDAPIFNGALGEMTLDDFRAFPPQELPRLATKIAGPAFITERMMESLPQVGKTIYSWPQLGDAATLSGVAVAYALKRLALGEPLALAKCEVSLDALLNPAYEQERDAREAKRTDFLSALGL